MRKPTVSLQQLEYCKHRLTGLTPTKAALAAGFKQPRLAGYRLEHRKLIRQELSRLQVPIKPLPTIPLPDVPAPAVVVTLPPAPVAQLPDGSTLTRAEATSLLTDLIKSDRTPHNVKVQALKLLADLEKWTEQGAHVGIVIQLGTVEQGI
jgi:hypothetical protein